MTSRRALAVALVTLVAAAPAVGADAHRGAALWEARCSPCHGRDGKGDGPAASAMTPPPRNFRDPQFWRERRVEQLREVVKHGRPGTLMAGFEGVIEEAEIDDVVHHLESFRPAH